MPHSRRLLSGIQNIKSLDSGLKPAPEMGNPVIAEITSSTKAHRLSVCSALLKSLVEFRFDSCVIA
jgi:hypothetical protein